MASAVDICNLALSHLGDTATVASLDPPEGSAQAEHCARFYPVARDALVRGRPGSPGSDARPNITITNSFSNVAATWMHPWQAWISSSKGAYM